MKSTSERCFFFKGLFFTFQLSCISICYSQNLYFEHLENLTFFSGLFAYWQFKICLDKPQEHPGSFSSDVPYHHLLEHCKPRDSGSPQPESRCHPCSKKINWNYSKRPNSERPKTKQCRIPNSHAFGKWAFGLSFLTERKSAVFLLVQLHLVWRAL